MKEKIGFLETETCPLCGELHEIKYTYQKIPVLLCPKAEDNKIYGFNVDATIKTKQKEPEGDEI